MDNSNTKKKWVSSRLVKKKEELGIETKPSTTSESKNTKHNTSSDEKKPSKVVKKVSRKSNYKEGSKRGSKKHTSKFGSKNSYKHGSKKTSNRRRKGPKFVVRISNLPDNITVDELNYLVSEWGDIGNINVKKYTNYEGSITNCYIDFYNKEEADYFVKALDNTPFDCMIINVTIMDFSN